MPLPMSNNTHTAPYFRGLLFPHEIRQLKQEYVWHLFNQQQLHQSYYVPNMGNGMGRRQVPRVGSLFLKWNPEMPGKELAVFLLHQIIFGRGTPLVDIIRLHFYGQWYLFLGI